MFQILLGQTNWNQEFLNLVAALTYLKNMPDKGNILGRNRAY